MTWSRDKLGMFDSLGYARDFVLTTHAMLDVYSVAGRLHTAYMCRSDVSNDSVAYDRRKLFHIVMKDDGHK